MVNHEARRVFQRCRRPSSDQTFRTDLTPPPPAVSFGRSLLLTQQHRCEHPKPGRYDITRISTLLLETPARQDAFANSVTDFFGAARLVQASWH